MSILLEKRRYPRVDTRDSDCRIRIFGLKGKPLEEIQVLNLSLGGVAFVTPFSTIMKAIRRVKTKVEIQLPDGGQVDAVTQILRVKPTDENDNCLCVMELTEMNQKSTSRLENFIL
jgi:hypothetical protein